MDYRLTDEDKERFFYSLPIQHRSKKPLDDVISDYDIVIGPLTSCFGVGYLDIFMFFQVLCG